MPLDNHHLNRCKQNLPGSVFQEGAAIYRAWIRWHLEWLISPRKIIYRISLGKDLERIHSHTTFNRVCYLVFRVQNLRIKRSCSDAVNYFFSYKITQSSCSCHYIYSFTKRVTQNYSTITQSRNLLTATTLIHGADFIYTELNLLRGGGSLSPQGDGSDEQKSANLGHVSFHMLLWIIQEWITPSHSWAPCLQLSSH